MLTYQEGNTLYVQHQFLKDLAEEIRRNPDRDLIEFEEKLRCATISTPRGYRLSGNLRFLCIHCFDEEGIFLAFKGECVGIKIGQLVSARIRVWIKTSLIESFDSSATNGYFPVKIDF